ncbi:MAG: hypothetical protein CL570_00915 [Alphaproteobacteria bacterium]|nr:hypothetical protein [Alphaproteobacteria bacterium]|tara:strand:+ start:11947 stop:13983 length:2037 start_codon:yes stop_codon:yes gene_type:complete
MKQGKNKAGIIPTAFVAGLMMCTALSGASIAHAQEENAASILEARSRAELELQNKDAQIKQLKSVLNEKNDKLDELAEQLSAQELLLREKDILEAEITAMENKISDKESALQNAKENMAFKEGREAELNSLMSQMQRIIDDHETLLSKNEKYKEMLREKEGIENQLTGISEEKRMLSENMQILQDEYDSVSSQLTTLKEGKLSEFETKISEKDLEIAELRMQVQSLAQQAKIGGQAVAAQEQNESIALEQKNSEIEALRQQVRALSAQARLSEDIIAEKEAKIAALSDKAPQAPIVQTSSVLSEAQRLEQRMAAQAPSALLPMKGEEAVVASDEVKNIKEDPAPVPPEKSWAKDKPAVKAPEPEPDVTQRITDLSYENHELQRQNQALKTFLEQMTNTIKDVASGRLGIGAKQATQEASPVPVSSAAIPVVPAMLMEDDYGDLSEAQRMEREMMGGRISAQPAPSVAQDAPLDIATVKQSDIQEEQKPVFEVAVKQGEPIKPASNMPAVLPQSVAPAEVLSEPPVYYEPSVPIYGLVQASEGYVPDTFNMMQSNSSEDKLVFQWHEDSVYSSAEQRPVGENEFDDLVKDYLIETENRCQGDFAAISVDTRDVGDVRIDSYDIACIIDENGMNAAASLMFFNKDGTFSSVSHETATAYVDTAMDKRDKMIHTLEGASFF